MNAVHMPAATRTRPYGRAGVVIPVLAGMAFGAYTGFLDRNNGASTLNAYLLGIVGALVVGAISFLLGLRQAATPREGVATAYGALFGSAMGFLVSLNGANSVLKSTVMGACWGLGMFICAYYILLWHRKD